VQVQIEIGQGACVPRWGVIMAGGDGKRLLPLTRRLTGDDRPKQFCALTGTETLLDHTRRRVSRVVPGANTLLLLTRSHERFYAGQLREVPTGSLLVQPHNHGTATAIAYALCRLKATAANAVVAFFPSDHHFASEDTLVHGLNQAFSYAERDCDHVVLLGIVPESDEDSYGWIEPGRRLHIGVAGDTIFEVSRFWEKPSKETATRLWRAGCFWNSFIMVGRVSAFCKILRRSLPDLLVAFDSMVTGLDAAGEESALRELYSKIQVGNFSDDVLSVSPSFLAVLPIPGSGWTDLGEPERARSALRLAARDLVITTWNGS
jgi:mannose-1-phosphate guanylyltransferase